MGWLWGIGGTAKKPGKAQCNDPALRQASRLASRHALARIGSGTGTGTGTGIGIGNGIGIGGGEQQSAKNSAKKGKMGAEAEADEARFRLQRG